MKEIKISSKIIGENHPVFIIAELSCNHLNDIKIASKTIKAAKDAGVDAVKLQTVSAESLTIDCDNDFFQIKGDTLWDGQTLYELYCKVSMPWEWQYELKSLIEDLDMIFLSTPVDKTGVDFLEKLNVPAYKIASFEITDVPFLEYVASKNKPIIISTGIAELDDIQLALDTFKKMNNDQIVLLKCTSLYPTPLDELNLSTIPDLKNRFGIPVGLSDHSLDLSVITTSVALGAKIIEKHIILDRKLGGPDAAFSLEPDEFKQLVKEVRKTEKMLGDVKYKLSERVKQNRLFSRSLFVVKFIKKGELFSEKNIKSIRPGYGLHPKELKKILGKRAKIDIERGTPLKWEYVES